MNPRTIAAERQLDWLLDEVLGDGQQESAAPPVAHRAHWLAAALIVLAVSVAFGVARLRRDDGPAPAQQPAPEIPWIEVHGPRALAAVPSDAVALKCFDFDDDALGALAKFTKIEHLDLGGMDVDDRGYSVALKITDLGVTHLGTLTNLRSLSLARCEQVKGTSLHVLEGLPLLETLDLTYSGVESAAVERLPRLGNLRELTLSHCMKFHGRSLAAVAQIPGLRKLELQGCTTISAKDALHLANAKGLRFLDLRDCQGRFRGQTAAREGEEATFVDTDGDGLPDKRVVRTAPEQDGIGITDDVVAALASIPLETLLLGGSESLTDAIGDSLAKMTTLRTLDLSSLPRITAATLAMLPPGLVSLSLDDNYQFDGPAVLRLPRLSHLRELGLSGLYRLNDAELSTVLGRTSPEGLVSFRLGATSLRGLRLAGNGEDRRTSPLTQQVGEILTRQASLQRLAFPHAQRIEPAFLRELARMPNLVELDLTGSFFNTKDTIEPLGESRSIRALTLTWCRDLVSSDLKHLIRLPLRSLDLHGTRLPPADIRDVATAWPGCLITMPDGAKWRVPAK